LSGAALQIFPFSPLGIKPQIELPLIHSDEGEPGVPVLLPVCFILINS
jgi:hypothetical protein